MLVPDLMPVLTPNGLRLASQIVTGDNVWTGTDWAQVDLIDGNASARFYDYDFGTTTFRANAAAKIWQPGGLKCPAQLYTLKTSLGPDVDCLADAVAEWDGYFWAEGQWIDSLNKPCAKNLDESKVDHLMSTDSVVKLRDLYVHKNSRINKKSFDKGALVPSIYMHSPLPMLKAFLRGYMFGKSSNDGTMELLTDRHACTMQLALSAVGIESDRKSHILRFPDTYQVNQMMGTQFTPRKEEVSGILRAVLAKGELKCFSWDVRACWMSGVILHN